LDRIALAGCAALLLIAVGALIGSELQVRLHEDRRRRMAAWTRQLNEARHAINAQSAARRDSATGHRYPTGHRYDLGEFELLGEFALVAVALSELSESGIHVGQRRDTVQEAGAHATDSASH
jgi:hypothetical protein